MPSIKDGATYRDYWYQGRIEAQQLYDEDVEKELAPSMRNVLDGLGITSRLPGALGDFVSTMTNPTAPAWGAILARFGSEVADGIVGQGMNHALQDFNYQMAEWFQDLKIDKDTASLLWTRSKITEDLFNRRMKQSGFNVDEAAAYLESHIPYPNFPDVVRWARYNNDPDNFQPDVVKKHRFDYPDWPMWEWLTALVPGTDQIQTLYRKGAWGRGDALDELARIGWGQRDRNDILDLAFQVPNPMLLAQSALVNGADDRDILPEISRGGISPGDAGKYYDAIRTKPDAQDLIRFALRQSPNMDGLEEQLRKIGIHPAFFPIYRELAYFIPPVGDIITMAVREVFSPAVAARFGQFDDYPADLTQYAAMQGISEEWAKRYWAAHWTLPSANQGFEMLHRGVIDESDLDLLLRAQDVMPFWRDKLKAIAYNPLTRVDVRRMYGLGVLDEKEVYEAYLNIGYDDTNATRMAEFTVKQVLSTQSGFTSTDVTKAFRERLIDRGEALSLLTEIGIRSDNAQTIVNRTEYERTWDFVGERVKAIKNLYKKGVADENATRDALGGLNLPASEITTLMEQWYFEAKEEEKPLWTPAQTLAFLKKGLIEESRARQELQLHSYDQEHIDIYVKSVTT